MKRVCFTFKLKKDRLEEYAERHRNIWPEMRAALKSAGWHNYSLFVDSEGLLIGYLETDNFEEARGLMQELQVNERWQASMAPFFDSIDKNPDTSMIPLPELFHLD